MRVWLRNLRERAGMSQQQVADALGVKANYISMLELGTRGKNLNISRMIEFATVFDLDTETIIRAEISYIIQQDRGIA